MSLSGRNLSTAKLGTGSDSTDQVKSEFINARKVIWIVVSAIIFVVIVAIYELLRISLNNYFYLQAVEDPRCNYKKHKCTQELAKNHNNLISACIFALLTILTAAIILPILFSWVKGY